MITSAVKFWTVVSSYPGFRVSPRPASNLMILHFRNRNYFWKFSVLVQDVAIENVFDRVGRQADLDCVPFQNSNYMILT